MLPPAVQKLLPLALGAAGLWLGVKYLLPVLLPFALGALLALAAEPAVSFGVRKFHWRRGAATAAGMALTLVLLLGTVSFVGALAVKELGSVAQTLPDLQDTVQQGMTLLKDAVSSLSDRAPAAVQPLLRQSAAQLFDGNVTLVQQAVGKLPGMVSSVLGWLPGGALGLATGILSGFMISARLPKLKKSLSRYLPDSWRETWLPAARRMKKTVGGWLKAQAKLSAVTWGIVTVGFWLLKIPHGPAWAVLVALVDAVPLLGTGTVLLPWALISLLQGRHLQALGLVVIYACALLTRTALEPRLVGRQIGLDPLVTLVFLYAGFRLWGVLGMILAPMLAAAVKSLFVPEA